MPQTLTNSAGLPVTVRDLANADPLDVALTDSAGNQLGTTTNPVPVYLQELATQLTESIIDHAANGANTIVAGVAAQTIRVHKMVLVCKSTVGVTIRSGTTNLTGAMTMKSGGSIVLDLDTRPWFTTAASDGFVIFLSAAVQISGRVYYKQS